MASILEEAPPLQTPLYRLSIEESASILETNLETGLTEEEAAQRLVKYGRNELRASGGIKIHMILFRHTFNFMSIVIFVATIVALLVREWIDAIVIGLIIVINVIIGFCQEYSSEKTLENLKKMSSPVSKVLRSGKTLEIPSAEIVRGDLVLLTEGDKVPADMRIIQVVSLECDEALLTGESVPVEKKTSIIDKEDIPPGDQINQAFMGATVTKGKGKGIVYAIGVNTEIGKIAESISGVAQNKTQLQVRMEKLGMVLVVCAITCIGLVMLGCWAWDTAPVYPDGLKFGISTAIAIIPEGLIPVITLTLTLGVRNMAKKNTIVRKLNAVESLGNVTDICSDKTGTLTEGKMVATHVWSIDGKKYTVSGKGIEPIGDIYSTTNPDTPIPKDDVKGLLNKTILIGSLCNVSAINKKELPGGQFEWVTAGSPTEVALVILGHKVKLDKDSVSGTWKHINEYPFSSSIKRMSMVYKNTSLPDDESLFAFVKGAPEGIVSLCQYVATVSDDGSIAPRSLTGEDSERIKKANIEMASEGLRVLALSYRKLSSDYTPELKRESVEQDLIFVGLVGIRDPPKQKVAESVRICHEAGIVVRMVTGDHPVTSTAIAKQIGIISDKDIKKAESHNYKIIMVANEFDKIPDDELAKLEKLPKVIARCTPDSKVKMVKGLHQRNKVAAMTGDGVNDAPAIKHADVGVAMGKAGSEVTKEASDMIITDDDFSTIVEAVKEGRKIFANIRKFIIHLLTGNTAEAIVLVLTILSGLEPPLNPLQILWVNMVTGTGPALALGMEPPAKKIMDKTYRPPDEALFTKEMMIDTAVYGTIMGGLCLINFFVIRNALDQSLMKAQGVTFLTLTLLLLVHAYNCRVLREPFYRHNFLKRLYLHGAVLFGFLTIIIAFYIPFMRDEVFKTGDPEATGWGLGWLQVAVFMIASEIYKIIKRRYLKYRAAKLNLVFIEDEALEDDEEEQKDDSIELEEGNK